MLRIIYTFILCAIVSSAFATSRDYSRKSALSEGRWVKVRIKETGFYKLTYADLKKMGFANPEKVSVHGYGGFPMDEDFSKAAYYDDVPSITVWRGSDYIIFYGKGTTKWSYQYDLDERVAFFAHENNAYSNYGYYFVTDATAPHDATAAEAMETGNGTPLTVFDDYMLHEVDKVSLTNDGRPYSGRELFGENFTSNKSHDFTFPTPGITSDNGLISYRFVSKITSGEGLMQLSCDGIRLDQQRIRQIGLSDRTYTAASSISPNIVWSGDKNESTKINLSFSVSQQTSYQNCHLDYIRLQMKRQLQPYGACTFFRCLDSRNKVSTFSIQNAHQNLLVFDVSEGEAMKQMKTELNGTTITFTIPASPIMREFAMVDISKTLPAPETIGEVANQNLHGMEQMDMVILSAAALTSEAERLAEKHRSHDNLKVVVVTPEQIYNEFSSGTPEATAIRNFMKMFYDRRTSETDAPKYLLFFGDGIFDNRHLTDITSQINLDNYLLTYQSQESIGVDSYVSDDYFGYLHDDDGGNPSTASVDIGIGRFPVSTLAQARNAVNKVIAYIDNTYAGKWKNRICFVADDGNNNDGFTTLHMSQSNTLAEYMEEHHPEYVVKKLFFDAYKKSYSAGKPTYPDIQRGIQQELKNGVLLINYTGHGDADSWSEERVVTTADIVSSSYTCLPLWITAACDFAPFDASTTSAGEEVFLNATSGGIALFTTARVAYRDPNFSINRLFMKYLFQKDDGIRPALGDVMKNMKNGYQRKERHSFVLLGDPALKLAYPDFHAEVTEINGIQTDKTSINIRALENVTVKGRISTAEGNLVDDFNGPLSVTVFDSRQDITTLDNNNRGETFTYSDYPSTIHTSNESVRNGEFSFTFTVPKDISYSNAQGKINLYATDGNGTEANGSYKNFTIGGTAPTSNTDTIGPEIRALYLNSTDFKDGGIVNTTPLFSVILWDESGINLSSGNVGHNITLTIDGSYALTYVLNEYYEKYPEGEMNESIVRFPIPTLEAGLHTAEFKVWDIFNNSTSKTFTFIVSESYSPEIFDLTASPVPAHESVTFTISHNMPESETSIELQVFDLAGRMMWRYAKKGTSDVSGTYRVTWNITDGNGGRALPGIYIYRAILTNNHFKQVSKSKKLIIATQ